MQTSTVCVFELWKSVIAFWNRGFVLVLVLVSEPCCLSASPVSCFQELLSFFNLWNVSINLGPRSRYSVCVSFLSVSWPDFVMHLFYGPLHLCPSCSKKTLYYVLGNLISSTRAPSELWMHLPSICVICRMLFISHRANNKMPCSTACNVINVHLSLGELFKGGVVAGRVGLKRH